MELVRKLTPLKVLMLVLGLVLLVDGALEHKGFTALFGFLLALNGLIGRG